MTREEALAYRASIEQAAALQSDKQALDNIYLYPNWEADKDATLGIRWRFNDVLYKCVQAHHTQADWTPDVTPALWTRVSLDEYPEWIAPTGAQDAYAKDDKVSHNNKHWISLVDANVWEPGAVGTETLWQEVA